MPSPPSTSTPALRFEGADSEDEIGDPVILTGQTRSNSPGTRVHASSRHGPHDASHFPADELDPSSNIVRNEEGRVHGAVSGADSSSDEQDSEIAAEAFASAEAARKQCDLEQSRAASESAESRGPPRRSSDHESSGFNWAAEAGPFAVFLALAAGGVLLTRFLKKRSHKRLDDKNQESQIKRNIDPSTVHLPGRSAISDKFGLPISTGQMRGSAGPSDTTFTFASV